MRKQVLLLIGVGGALACNKTAQSHPKGWDWFGTHDDQVYSYVLLSANQVTDKSDTDSYQISVSAAFIDSNTNTLHAIGNLSVENRTITRNVDNSYSYGYGNPSDLQEAMSLFGRNVMIQVNGESPGDTVTATVYLPKKIVKLISDFPDSVASAKDVTLSWEPDNQYIWGQVVLQVYYYPSLSRARDPGLPQNIKPLNFTVPDNGNYILHATDLNHFPANAYIGISIARGSQNLASLPLSKRRIYFFSSSSASTLPLLVTVGY